MGEDFCPKIGNNEVWHLDYAWHSLHVIKDIDSWEFIIAARIERERPYTCLRMYPNVNC